MIEIEKNGTLVFRGTKEDAILYLKQHGLEYKENDIPLLILGHLATNIGYDVFCR